MSEILKKIDEALKSEVVEENLDIYKGVRKLIIQAIKTSDGIKDAEGNSAKSKKLASSLKKVLNIIDER